MVLLNERFNKTLISMLSMYCKSDQTKWNEYLQQVMMAYCASADRTGKTLNMMNPGREVLLPKQTVIGKSTLDDDDDSTDLDD